MHGNITLHPTGRHVLLVDVESGDLVGELALPPDLAEKVAGHRWYIWPAATRRQVNGLRPRSLSTHESVKAEHETLHQSPKPAKERLVFNIREKTLTVQQVTPERPAGLLHRSR